MRLLDRYIGRELLVSLFLAVATLSFVLVLGQVFKKLFEYVVDHDTPLSFIATFIAYALPASLTLTIPWGFLTAVLLVFGRLSGGNELTALRASGVSTPRVAAPVVGLALLFCGLCAWLNLDVAPRAQGNLKDAFFRMATTNPTAAFGGDQVIDTFPGRRIYIGRKEGNELENIHVFEMDNDQRPVRVITANRGRLETDRARRQIKMYLEGSRYEQRETSKPDDLHLVRDGISAGTLVFPISLEELYAKKQGRRRVESMSVPELLGRMGARVPSWVGNWFGDNRRSGGDVTAVVAGRETAGSGGGVLVSGKKDRDRSGRAAAKTELNRRFSYSLACLTFAFIGIPLGITANRQETSIGFGLSLAVAFSYYLIIIVVNTFRDKAGMHPELWIWLPNALFLLVGGVLFYRLSRR